jgi:hypothetical protein
VFTARYALSPYIKQTCFVFKGLIAAHKDKSIMLESEIIANTQNICAGKIPIWVKFGSGNRHHCRWAVVKFPGNRENTGSEIPGLACWNCIPLF